MIEGDRWEEDERGEEGDGEEREREKVVCVCVCVCLLACLLERNVTVKSTSEEGEERRGERKREEERGKQREGTPLSFVAQNHLVLLRCCLCTSIYPQSQTNHLSVTSPD